MPHELAEIELDRVAYVENFETDTQLWISRKKSRKEVIHLQTRCADCNHCINTSIITVVIQIIVIHASFI